MPYWFSQARRPGRVQSPTVRYRGRTYQFSATDNSGAYNIDNFYKLPTRDRINVAADHRDISGTVGYRARRSLARLAYYYRRHKGMTLFGTWYII